MARAPLIVGLISDTHGLLRPQALEALAGSDYIVHAGDIGDGNILKELARIAPVTAVRGNNDTALWGREVPETAALQAGAILIHVIHDIAQLDAAAAARHQVIVAGHSHKPGQTLRDGVLYVNPGSAGPQRFRLPVSVARLHVEGARVTAELVMLEV